MWIRWPLARGEGNLRARILTDRSWLEMHRRRNSEIAAPRRLARAGLPFLAALLLFAASPALAAQLTVTVDNLRNGTGEVRLSAYASAAEWPDKSTDDHDKVEPAQAGSVVFHFDLPAGTYAVACFHDENANGKFDKNFLGIPVEGYAFSNNVRPVLAAPSFASASFVLPPQGAAITIHMVY